MTNEHYEAVLEDLERERAELDATIATLRRRLGLPNAQNASGAVPARQQFADQPKLRSDEFFGMSIIGAARKYLSIVKQPTSAPNIAREIKSHGLMNDSKTFPNTVYSILYREAERPNGQVVKVGGSSKWGLTEWYPMARQSKAAHLDDSGGAPDPILPEQSDEQSESEEPS